LELLLRRSLAMRRPMDQAWGGGIGIRWPRAFVATI
jgi:hypothetical protein